MLQPSKLLLTSNLQNNHLTKGSLLQVTSDFRKLILDHTKRSEKITPIQSAFRPLIMKLISDYQKAKIRNLDNLRIDVYMKARSDTKQLPQPPKQLDNISNYVFDLVSLIEYELTKNNRDKKQRIIDSFISNIEDLKAIDDKNNVLLKSILIESIIRKQFNKKIYDQLEFDVDVFYILCFKYFMNPLEVDRDLRLLDLAKCLLDHNEGIVIDTESWKLLNQLINKNILSVDMNHKNDHSTIFSRIINLIDEVDACYDTFNLIGMLRVLRNAEIGFERVEENDVIKFDIGFYRYMIIDRALCEWNKESLTLDVWECYNFEKQWKTIWEVYYEKNDSIRPGGPTTMKHVHKLVFA